MVNGIDGGMGFFYTPRQNLQTRDQVQGLDAASAMTDSQNKDLGPKECKT
jgi:hypothetical protein